MIDPQKVVEAQKNARIAKRLLCLFTAILILNALTVLIQVLNLYLHR